MRMEVSCGKRSDQISPVAATALSINTSQSTNTRRYTAQRPRERAIGFRGACSKDTVGTSSGKHEGSQFANAAPCPSDCDHFAEQAGFQLSFHG
jgi:hypothetical protein